MRSLVLGLLAVLVFAWSPLAAQGMRDSGVDPRTYTSPSGDYALHVDPSARNGAGPATYRLSRQGTELWTTTHAFTWTNAFVCDDGASAGYAYTHGGGATYDDLGSFVVVVLDPKGAVRERHATARTSSSYLHTPADPRAVGLIPFRDLDRFVVRVADEDVNRQSESWWPFRISTGDAFAPLRPKDGQADTESLRDMLVAVPVRDTPLTLVQWIQYGPFEPGRPTKDGTRFALVDEQGASVWSLDLPEDYTRADEDEVSAIVQRMRERETGAVARWDEARRFDLDLAREAQRVKYEVVRDAAGTWSVREVGRVATAEAEAAPVVAPTAEATPAPTPLALVGVVDLETCKTPVPFVHNVSAFAFDGAGNVAFLHWEQGPARLELGYADTRGARIAEQVLPKLESERGQYESDLAWLCDDRFLVGWSAYSSNPPGKAKLFAVSARTGECRLLAEDFGYELSGLAGFGDGRFLVLGDNRLDAFDASGKRLWKLTSADGLCGADHVAVLNDGRIVVSDRSGIQWIAASGKLGRYEALEKLWGREPRYLCGLEAGLDGGLIVQDFDRSVSMDAARKPLGDVTPRFADGRAFDVAAPLRAGPGGRVWTSDGYAILGLDARGQVELVLGEGPEVRRLTKAAAVALGPDDRIHAASERTGDVHLIDVDKGLVRVLRPAPTDFRASLVFTSASLTVDDEGDVRLGSGEDVDRTSRSHSFVRWSANGERKGVERLGLDAISEAWIAQAGTKNRWVLGYEGNWLVAPDGKVLVKLERRPDGQWLKSDRAFGARDGTIAFLAGRDAGGSDMRSLEAVVYAADGSPRVQVPLVTSSASLHAIAYDGARMVLIDGDRLHVHDIASGAVAIRALPGLEGVKTSYWTPFLPRTRDEVWLFDGDRTLLRYALPRR